MVPSMNMDPERTASVVFWEGDGFAWDREEKSSWTWTGDEDAEGEEAGGERSDMTFSSARWNVVCEVMGRNAENGLDAGTEA